MTFQLPRPLRFTVDDANEAFDHFGFNCGPGAIAAIVGMTPAELRPLLGDFEGKRYTNPTLMFDIMGRLFVQGLIKGWQTIRMPADWPAYGLARIQWEGPWTAPGVPARVAYRQTHWVGVMRLEEPLPEGVREPVGIFDINAMANGTGWSGLRDWSQILVPEILRDGHPHASGKWHLTHLVEVDLP